MYYGDINCREDILREFRIDSFEGRVVHAFYEYADYSGLALVIYIHDGMFHLVQGSHCSCHGLEDQWEPEEMSAKALAHMIREGKVSGLSGMSRLAQAIETLDDLLEPDSSEEQIEMWMKLLL